MADPAAPAAVPATPQPVNFDVAGARKAGYSDSEIASYLGQQARFDVDAARKAGYDDSEIVHYLAPPPAPPKTPAPPPEPDGFWSSVGKGIENAPALIERAVGGALRAAGESGPPSLQDVNPAMGGENDPQQPDLTEARAEAAKSANVPGTPASVGKHLFEAATADLKANAPHVEPGSLNDYAYQVTQGVAAMLPIIAISAATKSPALGAAAMGGQAYAEKYGEARENGRAPNQASMDAGFTGLVNGALGLLPLHVLMKPGETFLGKTLQTAGAAAFQNVATEALQMGYDTGILDQHMTLGDAITRLKDAGIVGAVTGGLLGAGEHGISRLTGPAAPESAAPQSAPQPPATPSRTPQEAAAPVMSAGTVDDAIKAAQAEVDREPIDIEAMAAFAKAQAAAAVPMEGERGINDVLETLDMGEGQNAATPAPEQAEPVRAAAPEQKTVPLAPVASTETPVPATASAAEAQPEDAPEPADTFNPRQYLTDALALVRDRGKSLSTENLAAHLDVTPEQASRVAAVLASTPDTGVTLTRGGDLRRQPISDAPLDAAGLIAAKGGIRDDEGHDLKAGRGLQQFVPGQGPLIRPNGMSIDAAGEALWDAGFFGNPDHTPRPAENDVLQLLERTRRGDDNRPTKVYAPEDAAAVSDAAEGARAEVDNARVLQDIQDEAHTHGETLTPDEVSRVADYMGAHGLNPEVAVSEYLDRKYARLAEDYHDQTGDQDYAEAHPFHTGAGEIDLGHGEGGEGPAPVAQAEGGSGEGRPDAEADTGQARELATERGAEGFDQTIIPGTEASARQMAQAREDAGRGRIRPDVAQKPADEGLFGEGDEPVLFDRGQREEEIAPPFFSALTRAVEGVKMEKATPGQWEATIKNLPGVKAEELDWSGVNDWLRSQTKSVSKTELLDYLRENEVQVKEVTKGDKAQAMPDADWREMQSLREIPWQERTPYQRDRLHSLEDIQGQASLAPKFSQYTLPGGENYRELLMTLPEKIGAEDARLKAARDINTALMQKYGGLSEAFEKWTPAEEKEFDRVHAEAQKAPATLAEPSFRSSYFDEPNILAHVRMDDRTSQNGEKVLHVAEVQSDWHQQGRRKGYKTNDVPTLRDDLKADELKIEKTEHQWRGTAPDGRSAVVGQGVEATEDGARDYLRRHLNTLAAEANHRAALNDARQVPDAHFKATWHELAMKRVLRYAAEHGYDRVSWDTGETQAARYDLSKQVDSLLYKKNADGTYRLSAQAAGRGYLLGEKISEAELENHVGKDVAKRIAEGAGDDRNLGANNQPRDVWKELSGDGLKVGGEGMKGFYDKILPNFLNKYGKKWGAKVEDMALPGTQYPDNIRRLEGQPVSKGRAEVHSIPITDAMRESVLKGQPMFARFDGEYRAPVASAERVRGVFTPEMDAKRAEVHDALRQRLDELGLPDIALKLPDRILAGDNAVDGAYAQKIVAVALDAKDARGTLDHEAIHALRGMGLFNKSEWSILRDKAIREWRDRFKIDTRYSDFNEDRRNEEAVAEAFRYWVKGSGDQRGTIARIFDKVRNTLTAIGNVFRGRGFQTADDVFNRIDRGEVGARDAGGTGATPSLFSRREDEMKPLTEKQFYKQYVQHIDLRGRANGNALETRDAIMRDGFKKGMNVNGYPPYNGHINNVMDRAFQPREGDVVYLAPKGAWKNGPNGAEIQNGWKPQSHEAIVITDPSKTMYQNYLEAIERGRPAAGGGGGDTGGTPTMFSRRTDASEEYVQRDQVAGLIEAASGGDHGADTGARLLNKIAEAGIKQIKNPNAIETEALLGGTLFPRTMASLDDMSARLWRPWMAREEEGHATTEKLRRVISDSLVNLSAESRDRVYAALELARKFDWRPPDDGRLIRVRNSSYWQAQKSKVGDNYVLTQPETKAFHDALRLGDEGWKTFMAALARREGWTGSLDPNAIREAANNGGPGLPEGKRLLKLADVIDAAQHAMDRPYFPASRFGDLYIAVKAKPGTDTESIGGFPKVEWFQTVERPVLNEAMGRAKLPAADTPGVKEALAAIKARTKGDGSIAFPEDKYDFEVGDLRSKPNILRQLNMPAVEKLFMMMERGVTESLRNKIMDTLAPAEGATGKEAAGIKASATEAAKAAYDALAGQAKDTLLDAVYHDLLSGWKKQANMVPGYSEDFDRAIGTHIYQVGRNAADIVYRNDIEDAYQNIQDNHPHVSARQYWAHWKSYQETPANFWARAAGKTAQYGAAYVMGLNPSTTMMIGAHTPIMATPVLGVGGGMGQATAQMLRATREVYKALSFDKKKGGYIDTAQIGKTDREKAMIAELDRLGLNHSLGADDVRALNDRQAGLWGQAAPTMRKALDIAMSNVSAVDQANRNAIALAAHRMAMNPVMLEKMAAPWMQHNAIFREMVKSEGLTPENFTKFMLSEAAGAWGKTNQAPMMRGMEGSLLFALHGFQTRFLSTAFKLMKNMGPEGRVAASWMMAALWAGTGIYGIPFTQDLENGAGLLWKELTGEDPMIDAHVRQFLADAGLGKIGTEVLLRGPLSALTGVDLGSRLGFGDVITRSVSASDLLGTIPSIAFGKLSAAWDRERSGQGMAAAGAELLPSALRSPARAAIEAKQGIISQSGNQIVTPDKIGTGDAVLRAVGLPPLPDTEARSRSEYIHDLENRDKEIHSRTSEAWANLVTRATQAEKDHDFALAHELRNQAGELLQSYNRTHWQTPITQETLGNAILERTNPDVYRLIKTPGKLRGEAYRNPYP